MFDNAVNFLNNNQGLLAFITILITIALAFLGTKVIKQNNSKINAKNNGKGNININSGDGLQFNIIDKK